jgi:hypothetical protein
MLRGEPEYRRRIRQKAEKNQRKTDEEERESANERHIAKIIAAIHGINKEFPRANDENTPQNRRERRWNHSGVIGLWAAAAVGATAILVSSIDTHKAIRTTTRLAQAARDQATLLELTERPWMEGEIQFTSPLIIDSDGARTTIKYTVKNTGKTPAMSVWRGLIWFAGTDEPETIVKRQSELCDERGVNFVSLRPNGFTIFPNSGTSEELPATISATDVAKARLPDGGVVIRLIACINYKYTFARSDEWHQTSYIIELDKKIPAGFIRFNAEHDTAQPNDILMQNHPLLPGRAS